VPAAGQQEQEPDAVVLFGLSFRTTVQQACTEPEPQPQNTGIIREITPPLRRLDMGGIHIRNLQREDNEFAKRLAGTNRADEVLDDLTESSAQRREMELKRDEARLVDQTGRARGPQAGGQPRSRR
jgi:hypothetical protein